MPSGSDALPQRLDGDGDLVADLLVQHRIEGAPEQGAPGVRGELVAHHHDVVLPG